MKAKLEGFNDLNREVFNFYISESDDTFGYVIKHCLEITKDNIFFSSFINNKEVYGQTKLHAFKDRALLAIFNLLPEEVIKKQINLTKPPRKRLKRDFSIPITKLSF